MCSIMEVTYYMHPDATSFTAIIDQTPTGVGDQAQFAAAAQDFTDMGVRYVNASRLSRQRARVIRGLGRQRHPSSFCSMPTTTAMATSTRWKTPSPG